MSKVINISLSDVDHEKMMWLCAREGKPISSVIREMIRRAHAEHMDRQQRHRGRLRVEETDG